MIFTFASSKSDGDLRIEAFLNKAFLWYCMAMESIEDHFRYYYTPLTEGDRGAKASAVSEQVQRRNAIVLMSPYAGRTRNPTGAPGAQRRVACMCGCWFLYRGRGVSFRWWYASHSNYIRVCRCDVALLLLLLLLLLSLSLPLAFVWYIWL